MANAAVLTGLDGIPVVDLSATSPVGGDQVGTALPPVWATEPRPELWATLPPEVVDLIIRALASTSRNQLVKLCRLSKSHYATLNPLIYRKIDLDSEVTIHLLLRTLRGHLYASEVLPKTEIINIGACQNLTELLSAFVAHRYQPVEMRLSQSERYHHGPDVKISEFRSLRRLLVQESRANEATQPFWLDQGRAANEVRCVQLPILETFLSVSPWGRICRNLACIHLVMPKLQNLYLVPDVRLLNFVGQIPGSLPGTAANVPEMLEKYAIQTLISINQSQHIKRVGILVGDSWVEPSGLTEDELEKRLKAAMDKVNKRPNNPAVLSGRDDFTFLFAYLSRDHVLELRQKKHPFALVAMEKVLETAFAARQAGDETLFTTRGHPNIFDGVDEDSSSPRYPTHWMFGAHSAQIMGPEYGQRGIDRANGMAADEDDDSDDDDDDDDDDEHDEDEYDEEGDSQMEDADGLDSDDEDGSDGTVAGPGDTSGGALSAA